MTLIGIIGGAGAEGSHFAEVFKQSGLEVAVSDIDTEKVRKLVVENDYQLMSSEELAESSDLVVFSLPIGATESEIKRLVPLVKEDRAVTDLTSVKTKAVNAMLEYANPEVEVFSIHAMYRPTVSPWNQNVIFIPGRPNQGGKWFNVVKDIMKKNKANVSILQSAQQHDELATALQVLPHTIAMHF